MANKKITETEELLWTIIIIIMVFAVFLIGTTAIVEHKKGVQEGINQSQINISQAYMNGLLLWTQTGKLVYLE